MNKSLPCGCSFPINKDGGLELPDKVPEDCQKTWDLISDGMTWGVFQLDSSTGQKYSEEAKPRTIDELADVQSIIRPGTLGVKEGGKNLAQHYCDRKHNKESVEPMHSSVENILKDTQQIIVYQEQAMKIAKELAGFSGSDADLYIRKAIGKKKADLITEAKKLFLEGCKEVGIVNNEKAQEIFQGIESAGRYSFNACLCPETTLVELEDGSFRNLNEVQVGDKILDHNEQYTNVVNKYDNGLKEVFRWGLESGENIICTRRHKFLCSDGKIRPINIIARDCLEITTRHGHSIVDDIQCLGEIQTVDIEVDNKEHLFLANGIATSNSHGVSYAYNSYYYSAYIKAHFPRIFYCTEIQFAKDNDVIRDAVNDAKKLGIFVRQPCLKEFNAKPIIKEKDILFPLARIKFCSESHIEDAEKEYNELELEEYKYIDWLVILKRINKGAAEALVKSGAMDFVGVPRERFWKDLEIINKLTGKKQEHQLAYIKKFDGTISQAIESMIELGTGQKALLSNIRVVPKMQDFAKILKANEKITSDNLFKIAEWEKEYLGVEITCTKLDSIRTASYAYECIDVFEKKMGDKKPIKMPCIIDELSEWDNGAGKTHCFIKIYDSTCVLDAVIFDKNYSEMNKSLLYEGNTVLVGGKRSSRGFLIDSVKQL